MENLAKEILLEWLEVEKRLWDIHVLVHFQEDCEVNKTDKALEKVSAREFFYSLFFCFKLETLDHFKMLGRSISLWPSLKKKKKDWILRKQKRESELLANMIPFGPLICFYYCYYYYYLFRSPYEF